MQISVEDAQDILDELVDRALAGEEIVLMLDGRPVAQIVAPGIAASEGGAA